jgi:TonB-dependent starch-binding outer membrane protein SusC
MFRLSRIATVILVSFVRLADAQPAPHATCSNAGSLGALGASAAVLDSSSLAPFFRRTLSEALTARLPGVSVMRSNGVSGTGSRIWLRGPGGITMPQQPLLYIDGVRAGGQAPSRLYDVSVDDVSCVYVLRGPATVARYGTDAAGGVIYVVTRQAAPDSSRFRAYMEGGATTDATDYPANYGNAQSCTQARAAIGQCIAGPVREWNPLKAASPFRSAPHAVAGARVTMLATTRWSLGASGIAVVDDGALRGNDHRQYTGGVNGGFRRDSAFAVHTNAWLIGGRTRLPMIGNSVLGVLGAGLLGRSVDDPQLRGYLNLPPTVLQEFGIDQRLYRLGGVARVEWQPRGWLALRSLAGREDSQAKDDEFDPGVRFSQPVEVTPPSIRAVGERRSQRTTASVSAAVSYGGSASRLTTDVAFDYVTEAHRATARAFDVGNPSSPLDESWRGADATTKGLVLRQIFSSSDRRFAELGFRSDVLRRGVAVERPTYPFASLAWDVGREAFFPAHGAISSLRLRAAYGESGDSRAYDAIQSGSTVALPANTADALPVERTSEMEAGVDVGMGEGRVTASATFFSKQTRNALVEGLVSSAGGPQAVVRPAAEWRAHGIEVGLHAQVVDAPRFGAHVALTFTGYENQVTSLGNIQTIPPLGYGVVPGYPLYGAWGQDYIVIDSNRDGVITPAEVMAGPERHFLGSPVPTFEVGLAPSVVFAHAVTVAALVDSRSGFRVMNQSGRLRCVAVCAELYVPDASEDQQTRAVDGNDAFGAWIEDGSFIRLRELSVAWALPSTLSRRIGARSSTLVLAGRNVLMHTKYTGLDPEASYTGQSSIGQVDLFTLPLPRTFSVRLNVDW